MGKLLDAIMESNESSGHMEDLLKSKVQKLFNQEIDDSDISHEIDDDGYGFKIVRQDGKTLTYDVNTGKYIFETLKESLDSSIINNPDLGFKYSLLSRME